jgi:ribonuclease P protein component
MVVRAVASRSGEPVVRIGFVVSRAVGGAVVRNRVKRRLRHAARAHLALLDANLGQHGGYDIVVRALPAAADASFAELASDLAGCLDTLRPVAA